MGWRKDYLERESMVSEEMEWSKAYIENEMSLLIEIMDEPSQMSITHIEMYHSVWGLF